MKTKMPASPRGAARRTAAIAAIAIALSFATGGYAATPRATGDGAKGDAAAQEQATLVATEANQSEGDAEQADIEGTQGLTVGDILVDAVEQPAWVTDELADCGVCHTRTSDDAANEMYLYASHAIVSCFACHDDADTLDKRHEGATQAKGEKLKKLKKTEANAEVCVVCHDAEELVETTADCTALTDKDGNVVNPHDVPANDRHDETVTCASCHKFHKDLEPQVQAFNFCVGCHHAAVFECGTCHE